MQALKAMEQMVQDAPDQQVSLTDPDARSMATNGKGTATVGYNVQTAVDAEYHLIVAHEVTNQGHDRSHLAPMALKAQEATGCEQITALADRGYFSGDQVLSCEGTGVAPVVPKPLTSSGTKRGFFPAGLHLRRRARPLHLPGGGKTHAYPQLGSLNFGAFGASDARVWPAHVPVFGSVGNIPHEAEIGAFRGKLISNLCWYPSGPRYRRIVPRDR